MRVAQIAMLVLLAGGEARARGFEGYDFEDEAPLPGRDKVSPMKPAYCESAALKRVNNPASDSADEIHAAARESSLLEMLKFAGGCKGDVFSREAASNDWQWWADGPPGSVPEASRAAAALGCLDHHWVANGFPDPLEHRRHARPGAPGPMGGA